MTHANVEMERGRLNTSLAAIRRCWVGTEGGMLEDLPAEIERRAAAYHAMWPAITLTPTALATHWIRVMSGRPDVRSNQQKMIDELMEEG